MALFGTAYSKARHMFLGSRLPLHDKPADDILITVIFISSRRPEVTFERLRFLCQFMNSALDGEKSEILAFCDLGFMDWPVDQRNRLRTRFGARPIVVTDLADPVQVFAAAALHACGKLIFDARGLEQGVAAGFSSFSTNTVRFVDRHPHNPYFPEAEELIPVSAGKVAAFELFRNLHLSGFGVTREFRFIAEAKGLEIEITQDEGERNMTAERSMSHGIVEKLFSMMVPLMYRTKLWTLH
jgi:hypothetical protein